MRRAVLIGVLTWMGTAILGQGYCDSWSNRILEVDSLKIPPDEQYAIYHGMLERVDSTACPDLYSAVLRRLGNRYRVDRRIEEGRQFLLRSLPIDSMLNWHDAMGSTRNSLGRIYREQGLFSKAVKNFELAKAHYALHDYRYIGALDSRYNLAECLLSMGDTGATSLQIEEGFRVWHRAMADTSSGQDSTYYFLYSRLQLLAEAGRKADLLELVARLPVLKSAFKALPYREDFVCETDYILAETYERLGQIELAIDYYSKALNGAECDWNRPRQTLITNKLIFLSSEQEKLLASEKRLSELKTIGLFCFAALLLLGAFISILKLKNKSQAVLIAEQEVHELLRDQELRSVESMFLGQERERKRIAEELHDRLGGMLSTLKLHYSSVERQISQLSEQVTDQYIKARSIIDETSEEVRRISHDLYSGTLVDYGLVAALEQLADTLKTLDGPSFSFDINGMDERMDSELEVNLYRMIQEAVSNILKHAKASEVTVQLNRYQESVDLLIEDNGIGFDSNLTTQGIGLKNIASRAERFDGHLTIDSTSGRGTTLIIQIPINS